MGVAILLAALMIGQAAARAPAQLPTPRGQDPLRPPKSGALEAGLAELIQKTLDGQPSTPAGVEEFYAARGHQPAWMSEGGREAARTMLNRMLRAQDDGLAPSAYPVSRLFELLESTAATLDEAFSTDVELTAGLLGFAHDLAHGIDSGRDTIRSLDVARVLQDATDAASARRVLQSLEPVHEPYHELRGALGRYRALAAEGGWPRVPEGVLMRPEAESEPGQLEDSPDRRALIEALCARLAVSGEIMDRRDGAPPACEAGVDGMPRYTHGLEQAVRKFQRRHGLVVDGIVGPRTIEALNRPVEDRLVQIAINMNRWRRLPDDLGWRHVHVNIPGFRLEAVDGGRLALEMRVVTGEPDWPTPVMRDEISYLEFRPYWNVPDSIAQREILPRAARNPAYLRQQNFEIVRGWSEPAAVVPPSAVDWSSLESFPYRIRQRPGPANAMGLVKFMFPNEHAVYLHDTPANHRFEERRRAFSHGCVRVEDPAALAAFLLQDQGWAPDEVRAAMQGGERQIVHLDETVPVYLSYFTAWVEDGDVQFRRDLYGLDARDRRIFETN